jgi:hypothetical protein
MAGNGRTQPIQLELISFKIEKSETQYFRAFH